MRTLLTILICLGCVRAGAQKIISKRLVLQEHELSKSLNFFEITYLSDGLKIKGFIVEPKYGGNLPVVIYNRGGNQDFGMVDKRELLHWLAPVAKHGYIVIASQYRGSPGSEGSDEMGGSDVNDVLNLLPIIDHLPKANPKRIAMYGWSRGGMMTYIALSRTKRIKTAIIGASPTDLARENKRRPEMDSICGVLIPGYKTNRVGEIQKRSAIYWPEKLNGTTSLLILHGTADDRVDFTESQSLAAKLEKLGHPHTLRLFKGGDHGLSKHWNEREKIVLEWLREHL
jgi:dipeptidyl aminopeptidase/acylaminoacyl peptidase